MLSRFAAMPCQLRGGAGLGVNRTVIHWASLHNIYYPYMCPPESKRPDSGTRPLTFQPLQRQLPGFALALGVRLRCQLAEPDLRLP